MLILSKDAPTRRAPAHRSPALQLSTNFRNDELLTAALAAGEGVRADSGALAVTTGEFTGRSARDKYVVDEPGSHDAIWWGPINQPMPEDRFDLLVQDVRRHLAQRPLWREHLVAGADPQYRHPVNLVTEHAWVALFSRHLFIVPDTDATGGEPITVLHAPTFAVDPDRIGTRSSTVIALHPTRRMIVIAGTHYAGEVKKSVFTLMQYLLPERNVATMHCSANVDASGKSNLFFGLSGTGKTTLSNDPAFRLVGDDEHGWSNDGVFNLEGGCYAKTIYLSAEAEPGIYAATNRPATVLENVVIGVDGVPDFDDASLTENARSAFSIDAIPGAVVSGLAPHPSRIVFLTADATGVLPPVARLSRDQAIGLFLLGFTSKIAGTERGLTEPEMTFSPAFGAPFLPLPPERYAELLGQRIDDHGPSLWLVNTGWSGGASSGERISIAHTRTIVHAIVDDSLEAAPCVTDPVLGLDVPEMIAGIPASVLHPQLAWPDAAAFDTQARKLREAFRTTAEEMGIDLAWLQE